MNKSVLIADDDLDCCNNLKKFFSQFKEDFDIINIANNGEKTLEMLDLYNPNILILDLNMPIKNGLEILRDIEKKDNCKTKVIIISGEIPMLNRLNLINSSRVIHIFIKPFNFSLLYSAIKNIECCDFVNSINIIDNILHEFSFNFSNLSYNYLLTVINKLLYRPFILQDVYKEIAFEQQITPQKIKWRIEKLILSMIRYTPNDILNQYIPYNKNPTPKIFIYEILKIARKKIENGN